MTRPFSDAYLLKYSDEHVWYEVWMFFEMATALAPPRPSASSTIFAASTEAPPIVPPLIGVNSVAPSPKFSAAALSSVATDNSRVEAFMTHLRNLVEFLFSSRPRPTDVVAADFCAAGTWKPTMSPALAAAQERTHKELAHLTSGRRFGSPPTKRWDASAIAAELRPVLYAFTRAADPKKLSPRVKTAIR